MSQQWHTLYGLVTPTGLVLTVGVTCVFLLRYLKAATVRQDAETRLPRGRLEDFRAGQGLEVTKASDYPDGWWTSGECLDAERRAIFAKV
jgi:hypothetical protein